MSTTLGLPDDISQLLMIFIDYTKQHDMEGLERDEFFKLFSNKVRLPAAIRRAVFNKRLGTLLEYHFLKEVDLSSDLSFQYREIRIHDEFLEEAVVLYSDNADIERPSFQIEVPAADRFVSLSDNQIDPSQAVESLTALSEAIRSSNDLFASAEERLQVSKEINALKEIVEQPNIRVSALWDATKNNGLLKWLTEQAASAVVRAAASGAFQHVEKLFQLLISKI